jgi:WG containing repeat
MTNTAQLHIEPQFDIAQHFSENLAAVQVKDQWLYVDTEGGIAIPPRFLDNVSPFKNGLAWIEKNGMWAYVNVEGQVVWLEDDIV